MNATSNGTAVPETCLANAVEDAYRLLHYAASTGRDITPAVRDPIIKLRAALVGGAATTGADEGAFLDAYARLAILAAPVTAVTLSATSALHAHRGRWARLLRLGPVSRAQALASTFGLVALALLVAIGAGEWTRTFMETVAATQKQFEAGSAQMRTTLGTLGTLDAQVESLKQQGPAANIDLLMRQREEVNQRV